MVCVHEKLSGLHSEMGTVMKNGRRRDMRLPANMGMFLPVVATVTLP